MYRYKQILKDNWILITAIVVGTALVAVFIGTLFYIANMIGAL